ncbi:MAG: GTP-sensing pleiotropic transcriptional regulator CodY [Firmicutes bacterium]|nr:GTP-sensing pleiotropic transcriptional regulator CodY [Bacillota bacterium]MBR6584489.1 GTP-sensing pleiotropic transcriptional regulator CodY [Bacillota bacterium]
MGKEILNKIRRLNWVLSESTTGNLSYEDLSRILSEIIDANVYILDYTGTVIGVAYNKEADSSTYENEHGVERVPEQDNEKFLATVETTANLIGDALIPILGADYEQKEKYHTIIPVVCGGERLGTLLLARYVDSFGDEDLALCEYGATVVGLEIRRNQQLEHARERSMRLAVDMAIETLSFSERDALDKILKSLEGDEGLIVTSKVASQYGLTNSVVVNAMRKMSSAGLLESRSLGMKGTHIRIINPFLKETVIK